MGNEGEKIAQLLIIILSVNFSDSDQRVY